MTDSTSKKKIFLVTADYRPKPKTTPYAVFAENKKEANKYFKAKFPWLKIFRIQEFTGDTNDIKCFW